jgi:hypothetical protein
VIVDVAKPNGGLEEKSTEGWSAAAFDMTQPLARA